MAGNEKELTLKLRVDDTGTVTLDKFTGKLDQAAGSVSRMSSALSLIKYDAIVNLGTRAFEAGQKIYEWGRSMASSLNDLQRESTMLGMTTTKFQELAYVAKMSNVNVEEFMKSMKFLANNMESARKGTGDALTTFHQLGFTTEDLTGKNVTFESILKRLIGEFSKYDDGLDKAAALNNIFGKTGYNMTQFMDKGVEGFDELIKKFKEYGFEIEEGVIKKGSKVEGQFKNWEVAWNNLKTSSVGYLVVLGDIIEKLTEIGMMSKNVKGFGVSPEFDPYSAAHYAQYAKPISTAMFGIEEGGGKVALKAFPALQDEAKRWKDLMEKNKTYFGELEKMAEDELKVESERVAINSELTKQFSAQYKVLQEMDKSSLEFLVNNADVYDTEVQSLKSIGGYYGGINKKAGDLLNIEKQIEQNRVDFLVQRSKGDYEEYLYPGGSDTREYEVRKVKMDEIYNQTQRLSQFWDSTMQRMGDSFSNNVVDLMNSGFKNIGDTARRFGMDVLGIFEKITLNALVFGNVMGKYEFGSGVLGWVAKLFSPGGGVSSVPSYQQTWGYTDAKTPGSSGGSFIPQGGMARQMVYNDNRTITTNYIDQIDNKGIEDRVTGPVIRGMSSQKHRQSMRNIIRRAL